ncbi:MAG: AAA family ATPase [Nanoarchaeota archaeon]|nr:AAA family ATPase [Nanoarchaeota archaeon]
MKSKLIIIRGSPASGKSTLARNLTKKIKGKTALLIVDEFRWIMTSHENRDKKDYDLSFDNFLYTLKNYLKSGYTVIAEDSWIKKHNDKSTDIKKVIKVGKKYKAKIIQILLKGSWKTVKHINTLRPIVISQKELKESYEKVYSKKIKGEIIIDIDNKKPNQILKEFLILTDN